MPPSCRDPLPRGVVRDLLGITRALYRAELALPPPRADRLRLERLEEIGKLFRRALELSRGEPDTMGHRAAWSWAEQATHALGEFVGEDLQLGAVLRASAVKLVAGAAAPVRVSARAKRPLTH
jgi:hypothetical protein